MTRGLFVSYGTPPSASSRRVILPDDVAADEVAEAILAGELDGTWIEVFAPETDTVHVRIDHVFEVAVVELREDVAAIPALDPEQS